MNEYHKIQTILKRDPDNNFRTLLSGEYSTPELEYLALNNWVFTEKVDGMNIRVMVHDGKVTFGGKTDKANIPPKLLERLQVLFLDQLPLLNEIFPEGGVSLR